MANPTSLKERLGALHARVIREAVPVDASVFKDPLALRTEWTPAAGGGANFRTHRLLDRGLGRMEFRPTGAMALFAGAFMAMGLATALAFHYGAGRVARETGMPFGTTLPVLIGLLFFVVGALMLWFSFTPRVFDRSRGQFWIGRAPPGGLPSGPGARQCRLGEIHALQLIQERCSGKNSSYWSYELNLVCKDGRRIHVVDHGALHDLRDDAQTLARMLGCKVWDATADPGETG